MIFGTFLTWSASNTADVIANVKDLISDLTPFLILIIPILLGLIIFEVIVHVIRGRH